MIFYISFLRIGTFLFLFYFPLEMPGKANVIEVIKARRTTTQFEPNILKDPEIDSVIEAGRWAPSSHNSQPWHFVIVKDRERISKLMRLCSYGMFYSDPPAIIAIVLEPIYDDKKALLNKNLIEFANITKYINIGCVIIPMVLQAESIGLSSAILSPYVKEANAIIGTPKGRETVILIALGREKKSGFKRQKIRKRVEELVSYEKYGQKRRAI